MISTMSTGLVEDREVPCGKGCSFSLGHDWATRGEPSSPAPESLIYWYRGFREDLDPTVLAAYQVRYPWLDASLWPTRAMRIYSALDHLRARMRQPYATRAEEIAALRADPFTDAAGFASAADCLEWVCGTQAMVYSLLADPAFRAAWEAEVAALV